METHLARPPMYDVDLFTREALRAPFNEYRALRDLGPIARLADPDVYVLARYDEILAALRMPDILINGKGVGFNLQFNTPGGPNLIQSDGDLHNRMKA